VKPRSRGRTRRKAAAPVDQRVTEDQVAPLLLETVPAFRARWESWLAANPDAFVKHSDIGYYNFEFLEELGRHLEEALAQQEFETFPAIFDAFERIISNGTDDAYNDIVIGLFESLQYQMQFDKRVADRDAYMPWLGPAGRNAWRLAATMTHIYEPTADEQRLKPRKPRHPH
jgi:hypothetical protein